MQYAELTCKFDTEDTISDAAVFSGVASTTDLDVQGDIVEAGVFEPINAKQLPLLRDHDRTQVIGGWRKFTQEGRQLVVKGELCLVVAKARETHALRRDVRSIPRRSPQSS